MIDQGTALLVVSLALLAVVALLGVLVIVLGRGHVRVRAVIARLFNINIVIEITPEDQEGIRDGLDEAAKRKGDPDPQKPSVWEVLDRLKRIKLVLACQILWVDDQPEGNTGESRVLQQMGQYVIQATSTEAAQEHLRRGRFDLVITDITRGNKPEAGLDLINWIRSQRIHVPIVVYSDQADTYRQRAESLGATAVARYPSELIMAVIANLNAAWPPVYVVRRPSRLRLWLTEAWRRNRPLVAGGLAGVVAALALVTGSAVAAVRLMQPSCLAMQPGDQITLGPTASTCPLRVGASVLALDCAHQLTLPAGRLLAESRDYDGHPTPVDGDGTVIVDQDVCGMSAPARQVETSLHTTGPPIGDGTTVVDFRPTTGASATFGVSVGGTAASRGTGAYLFIAQSGGGVVAQDRLARIFPMQGGPEPDAFNRLVICTNDGQLAVWLNGRQLGESDGADVQPGQVRVSLEDFDPASPARVDVRSVYIFQPGDPCET